MTDESRKVLSTVQSVSVLGEDSCLLCVTLSSLPGPSLATPTPVQPGAHADFLDIPVLIHFTCRHSVPMCPTSTATLPTAKTLLPFIVMNPALMPVSDHMSFPL